MTDVVSDRVEQFVGKVARDESCESCTKNAVVKIGGADGQRTRRCTSIAGESSVAVNGQ